MQFSAQVRIMDLVKAFEEQGLKVVSRSSCVVVHVMDTAEKIRYRVELEELEVPDAAPKVLSFGPKTTHWKEDVMKLDGKLSFRLALTSEPQADNPGAKAFVESAWKDGAIAEDGKVYANESYSIDTVRRKSTTLLSNGKISVAVKEITQKSTETAGEFKSSPEVTMTSAALDEACQTSPNCDIVTAKRLFIDLVDAGQYFCSILHR